ncbi:hypothetical protein ACFLR4_02570 [Bacteroidota bacterium]
MNLVRLTTVMFCTFLLLSTQSLTAQELNEHLKIFEPIIGKTWIGYFQNPINTGLTHTCNWEIIKNGNAVRLNKTVPEVDGFSMEITYYWDRIEEVVKFLTLSSNGYISNGTVTTEGNKIVTQGFQVGPDRTNTFKLTLEIGEDGNLHDYFYSLVDDNWKPGHYIKYSAEE